MLTLDVIHSTGVTTNDYKFTFLVKPYMYVSIRLANLGDGVVHEFSLSAHELHAYKSA